MNAHSERVRIYGRAYTDRVAELIELFRIGRSMYPEITISVEFPLTSGVTSEEDAA